MGLFDVIGSIFDSSKGAGFQGQSTPITYGANIGQANTAYDQTQQGLAQQQAFLQALQAQNGIGNQSSVFNQLQGVANGTGPNPAQAMLNQSTGQNVANQAALMAGQRGAGANAGLIARQAAQQGGALQQQAAGQGATMQANQSLNALNQLGGIAGQQVGQQANAAQGYNQAAQGQQANILNAIGQQNQANVGMQSNINNVNAGIAQGNQKFQQGVVQNLAGGLGSVGQLLGGVGGVGGSTNVPGTSPNLGVNTNFGSAGPSPFGANGGMVGYAQGGEVHPAHEPQSFVSRHLKGMAQHPIKMAQGGVAPPSEESASQLAGTPVTSAPDSGGSSGPSGADIAKLALLAANKGGTATKSMKEGGNVPGKAKVKGDSLKNDTVKAVLSPGEVVIPRSVMQSKDPAGNAAKFVQACMAKHSGAGLKRK